jgi:hypothetical protein
MRAHQLGERAALELFHNTRLMHLDGAGTDAEPRGDLTVPMACGDQLENLPLGLSQTLDARRALIRARARISPRRRMSSLTA